MARLSLRPLSEKLLVAGPSARGAAAAVAVLFFFLLWWGGA